MITNSQLMSLHFGRLKDDGKLTPVQVSMHKRHNVDVARKIASMSRGMLGGNGITDAYPVMRHMMNIEVSTPTKAHTKFIPSQSVEHLRESALSAKLPP